MREKLLMNRDWRFYFGEPTFLRTQATSSDQTYRGSRAANARGPARRDFDDRCWQVVQLPHDFVALNGVSETDAHGGEHYDFPMDRGSAWYRRYFMLDEADKDRRIVLHFEGMGTFCEVYVNSMLLKTNRTNGIGFDVDITDVARFGCEQNVVCVHCDCHDYEAWYYEGGGITRNVYLVKTDLLAVDLWGTFVRSQRIAGDTWRIEVSTEVYNAYPQEKQAFVLSQIFDEAGNAVSEPVKTAFCAKTRQVGQTEQSILLENPALWCPKTPNLYVMKTCIELDGKIVDDYSTTFGVREITYDKDTGMYINGESITIYGFANHMTYLGVGEAMTESMCEYQMRTLRDMGSNGFRTAHSPHSEATMDWCDRYGQLVMDENRIFHSSDIVIDEVRRLIKRDRNHPSVCMWSLYNEEDFVTHETGKRIFRTLAAEARKLDPTRPMTGATSYGMFSEGVLDEYDIIGINHQTMNFDALHKLHPDKPLYCSEMIFPLGTKRPMAGTEIRYGEDAHQMEKPYSIGGFHFTAWRYGPERPSIIGMEGSLGAIYYGFQAYLKPDVPMAKVCEGWDFPDKIGQEVALKLANNGEYVKVYVNGVFKDEVKTDLYAITPYKTIYEPGEIKIEAYKDGVLWAVDTAKTPGKPAKIELVCENRFLYADGTDTAIVSAYVVDANGNRCTHDTGRLVRFAANGAGELVTTLSIREDGFQGYVGEEIAFFDGKCQAIYRSLDVPGDLVITAQSEALEGAQITIARQEKKLKQVPDCPCGYVNGWRISKLYAGGMDDEKLMREHMITRWQPVDTVGSPDILYQALPSREKPGLYDPGTSLNYAYYTKVTVPDLGEKGDKILALRFEGIDGKANIYITDGKKTAKGHHVGDSPWFGHYRPELIVACDAFAPGDEVEIWVMMHDVGRVHGIGWPVHFLYTTLEAIEELDKTTARQWEHWKYRD